MLSAKILAEPIQRGGTRLFEAREVWGEVAAFNGHQQFRLKRSFNKTVTPKSSIPPRARACHSR